MNIDFSFPCNEKNYRKGRRGQIQYIVIHYVGATGSGRDNAKYYHNSKNIGASAHYFVSHASEGGAVYQSVADSDCAWHCGSESGIYYSLCRNDNSIGIEMCCHKDKKGNWYFDDITVSKAAELVKTLMKKYNISQDNVIRHYDVTRKNCPAPFVDEKEWQKFKNMIVEKKELVSVNDIVWELANRGIISDKALWLKKLKEDNNAYHLAKKAANYVSKFVK